MNLRRRTALILFLSLAVTSTAAQAAVFDDLIQIARRTLTKTPLTRWELDRLQREYLEQFTHATGKAPSEQMGAVISTLYRNAGTPAEKIELVSKLAADEREATIPLLVTGLSDLISLKPEHATMLARFLTRAYDRSLHGWQDGFAGQWQVLSGLKSRVINRVEEDRLRDLITSTDRALIYANPAIADDFLDYQRSVAALMPHLENGLADSYRVALSVDNELFDYGDFFNRMLKNQFFDVTTAVYAANPRYVLRNFGAFVEVMRYAPARITDTDILDVLRAAKAENPAGFLRLTETIDMETLRYLRHRDFTTALAEL